MSNTAFIKEIAEYVRMYAPLYDIRVCSPIIAQGILESNSGRSELAANANNFFGLKWRENRCPSSNGYYIKVGSEQNSNGSYVSSSMKWFKFPNMKACVQGYFDFINNSNYANLKGVTDPEEYLKRIKADGYATSLNYVANLLNVIKKYDLTRYDPVSDGGNKMRINVHAGHNPDGKVACGAIGFIKESTENRHVKNEVIRLLRALGHTVYDCTVDNGTSANNVLTNIVKKCNANNVDLDVSIHFNAGANDSKGNGKTTGTEVYVYNTNSAAKPYAQKVARAIAALGFKLRDDSVKDDVKNASYLYVLKNTNAPAMLIECCFVDDKDDVALYDYKSMAEAIVYGITGEKYEEEPSYDVDHNAPCNDTEAGKNEASVMYRVQVGAYSKKANAEAMKAKLTAAGFEAIITKA